MKAYMHASESKCMQFHPCMGIAQGGVLRENHSVSFRVEGDSFPSWSTNILEKPRGILGMKGHVDESHQIDQGTMIKLINSSKHRVRS